MFEEVEISEEELESLMSIMDTNKDGLVSFAEFHEFCNGNLDYWRTGTCWCIIVPLPVPTQVDQNERKSTISSSNWLRGTLVNNN